MTKKSAARRKAVARSRTPGEATDHQNFKPGIFGTLFQPTARWRCGCTAANTTKLKVPIREKELVPCRVCHRLTALTVEVGSLPQCWGGPEVLPAGEAPQGEVSDVGVPGVSAALAAEVV